MRPFILIPSRLAATRLPNKPLADISGVPMIVHVWRRAREAERKAAAEDEYRRLLYVGLTRAEDRLVICGYHGRNEPEGRWHALVSRAFARLGAQVTSRDEPLLEGTIQ